MGIGPQTMGFLGNRRQPGSEGRFEGEMAKNIYVGNLAWAATADTLLELFGKYGKVIRAQVITDRDTGRLAWLRSSSK